MGQKVHPEALRVGYIHDWKSTWFNERDFSDYLLEDIHIRGKRIDDARAILSHTPRAAATDIAKLLESAIANAENNFELDPDDLRIYRATVDEGPTIKRFRPRALGRATPIHKRTSHMTITLTTTADVAGSADTRKAGK